MSSRRPRLFYGWLIVFVSALGLFLALRSLSSPSACFSSRWSWIFTPAAQLFHLPFPSLTLWVHFGCPGQVC